MAPVAYEAIAGTAARLAALDAFATFDVGVDLAQGWLDLGEAAEERRLDGWFASLVARHGHRGTAGSLIGGALGRAVVAPTVSAMILDQRCPDPARDNLAIRLSADGDVERYGVRRPALAVLPDDVDAGGEHSTVVPDEAALLAWWAPRAARTLTPLLAAVRARAPFGLRALWGGVADEVSGVALWIGQLAGRRPAQVWSLGQQMVDALAPHAPVSLPRARPFPVTGGGTAQWFQVRGTCCLYYRSTAEPGPVTDRYCSTCPLRDDPSRERILSNYAAPRSTVD